MLPGCKSRQPSESNVPLGPTEGIKNRFIQARCDIVCRGHKFVTVPITVVQSFMMVRGNRPKPLFIGEDGKYLTREMLVTEVHLALKRTGYPAEEYIGHRFCIAAVQLQRQVARYGIQDSLITSWYSYI